MNSTRDAGELSEKDVSLLFAGLIDLRMSTTWITVAACIPACLS
jgi:hypothetical protein